MLKVNLPGMYSDSPQKQTAPEDFYVDSSHETVQRLHHAYRHDFRYIHLWCNFPALHNLLFCFRIFGYSSLSFDKVATGTTPEVFRARRRREDKLKRQHHFILRHLEKEMLKNLWCTLSAYKSCYIKILPLPISQMTFDSFKAKCWLTYT